MRYRDTFERLRAPVVATPDGASEPDWSRPQNEWSIVTYWGDFTPLTSQENLVGQTRTRSTHLISTPALTSAGTPTDVKGNDRIRYRNVIYLIDGDPLEYTDQSARPTFIDIYMYRVGGG